MFDAGLGVNSAKTRFKVPDAEYALRNVIDSEGEVFDYVFDVKDRRDAYWVSSVQIPVMLGGQWGKFYFLAGAKFDMALLVGTNVKASISTIGKYERYIDPLRNIPSQGFVDNTPWEQNGIVSFKPGVTGSAEIGMRLGPVYHATGYDVPRQKVQYRIALFGDYGILDTHREGDAPLMHVPAAYNAKEPMTGLVATDLMSSKEMKDRMGHFQSYMVGVKFTVLFLLPEKKACVICKDSPFRSTHGLLD